MIAEKNYLVTTREDGTGRYTLLSNPATVALPHVADAVNPRFVYTLWPSGSVDMEYLVASEMANIMYGIYDDFNTICRRRLNRITIFDIYCKIFGNTKRIKGD